MLHTLNSLKKHGQSGISEDNKSLDQFPDKHVRTNCFRKKSNKKNRKNRKKCFKNVSRKKS